MELSSSLHGRQDRSQRVIKNGFYALSMTNTILRNTLASLTLAATVFSTTALPAKANTTSTLLLGGAAAAGILTAVNVEHKHRAANTVEGYLPNGDTVYQDGHVVSQSGQSWYPGNQGQSVQCTDQRCFIAGANGYGNGYGNGNGYGDNDNDDTARNGYNNVYNGYNGYNGYNNGRQHGRGYRTQR